MARDFNGSTQEIALGDMAVTEGQSTLSMACWVNADSLLDYRHVFGKDSSSTSKLKVQFSGAGAGANNDLQVEVSNGSAGQGGYTTANILTAGTWYHIGFVFDGGGATNADKLKIYISGVSRTVTFFAAMSTSTPSNTAVANLGCNTGGTERMDGKLAEFAVWQRALPAAEMAALANRYAPSFFRRNLVCYMPLIRDVVDVYRAASITDDTSVSVHPPIIYPAVTYVGFHVPPPVTRAFAFNFG